MINKLIGIFYRVVGIWIRIRSILNGDKEIRKHWFNRVYAAFPCPCCMSMSMLNMDTITDMDTDTGTVTDTVKDTDKDMDMEHRHGQRHGLGHRHGQGHYGRWYDKDGDGHLVWISASTRCHCTMTYRPTMNCVSWLDGIEPISSNQGTGTLQTREFSQINQQCKAIPRGKNDSGTSYYGIVEIPSTGFQRRKMPQSHFD